MQFRYTLIDYTINPTGIARTVPEPLGWDGLTLKLERDKEYHGFFEYTDDEMSGLKFYNLGHDILKKAFDTYGIEAKVELKIEILCSPQVAQEADEGDVDQWLQLFYGRIDFDRTRFECGLKGCFAEAAATTSTCLMTLRNRFDQKVDLDSLKSFDSATNNLTPYSNLNFDIDLPEQSLVKQFSALNITTEGTIPVHLVNALHSHWINAGIPLGHAFQFKFEEFTSETLPGIENNPWNSMYIPTTYATPDRIEVFAGNPPFFTFTETEGICNNELYVSLRISGTFYNETSTERSYDLKFFVLKKPATGTYSIVFEKLLGSCDHCTTDTSISFNINDVVSPIPMLPGDTLLLVFAIPECQYFPPIYDNSEDLMYFTFEPGAKVSISSPSNCGGSSIIKTYLINEALSRTVEGVTNDCLRVYSDYFGRKDSQPYHRDDTNDGCGSLEVITNGLKIRNAYMKDGTLPRLQVSFKELVEGLNAIHCIGYGLEKDEIRSTTTDTYYLLRVEPFKYFYKNTVLLQCINVPNLKSAAVADQYVSTYKTGYAKWEAEEEGGMDDFFGQREYRTVLSTINKTLDKVCKFIASGYSTEVTRQQIGTDNTDWRYDNDVFILCVKRKPDDSFEIERGNITASDNLFDTATVINTFISPVRNALRWMRYLAQNIANVWDNSFLLYFTAGQGNYVAETQISNTCKQEHITDTLPENADLRYSTFEDFDTMKPLMYNILDEFEYPLSFKAYMNIVNLPYGRIKYACNNGEQYYGFIKSIKYKPTDGKATFQLLRAYTD